jgi:hypothetical protein
MKKEKKIFFEDSEELEGVLKALEKASADKVILVFSKRSPLGEGVENFHTLQEKAKILKKEILIESVDDHILELAAIAKIPAVNPVFRIRERSVSDIVIRPKIHHKLEDKITASREATKNGKTVLSKKEEEEPELAVPSFEEEKAKKTLTAIRTQKKEEKNVYDRFEKKQERERKKGTFKKFLKPILVLLILAAGWFVWTYILPNAKITLVVKRTPKDVQENVLISIKDTAFSIMPDGSIVLPGQLLSSSKNAQIEVPAQGKAQVNEKAKGKLTIYNGFDTKPQILVSSTRFISPDGKIFRLTQQIIVPGGKSENGIITPGSITADVVADQPGDAYNLAPVKNWKIPGFQGTPRFNTFYAENNEAMTGGFQGERPSATDADMQSGEAKLTDTLRSALDAQMSVLLTDKFKLIDGSTLFNLTKKQLQADTTQPDKAFLYGEADMKKIVFMEDMLASAIQLKYKDEIPQNAKPETISLDYGTVQADFIEGTIRVPVSGKIVYKPEVDNGSFLDAIKGRNQSDVQQYALSLPWFDSMRISFWPLWVKTIPKNVDRIELEIK